MYHISPFLGPVELNLRLTARDICSCVLKMNTRKGLSSSHYCVWVASDLQSMQMREGACWERPIFSTVKYYALQITTATTKFPKNQWKEKKIKDNENLKHVNYLPKSPNSFTLLVPLFSFSEFFLLLCCLHNPGSLHAEGLIRFGFIKQGSNGILKNKFIECSFSLPQFKRLKKMTKKHTLSWKVIC